MSPRTKQDNALIKEKMKVHLLDAALKVFSVHGYFSSTMQQIAKEADVSKGLIYHYFKNKEAILIELADKRLKDWTFIAEKLESSCPAIEKLSFLIDAVLEELQEKEEMLRLFNHIYLTQEGLKAIQQAMEKYRSSFERFFIAERRLFLDLGYKDPDIEVVYLRSTLQGIALEYMLSSKEYPLQAIKEKLLLQYKKE